MTERNNAEKNIAVVGRDVTSSVSFRMLGTKGQQRGPVKSQEEQARDASPRLIRSLCDEAVWQYHVFRRRGFLFWTLQLSIYYVQTQHTKFLHALSTRLYDRTTKLLTDYLPQAQAVVVSEHERIWDVFRITGNEITSRSVICRDHMFDLTEPLAGGLVSTSH